jgi:hypothetical protein
LKKTPKFLNSLEKKEEDETLYIYKRYNAVGSDAAGSMRRL